MEELELKKMWHAFNQKMEDAKNLNLQSLALNQMTFEYLQVHKVKSRLNPLASTRKWGVALGILWVLFLGMLVIGNGFENMYFSMSLSIIIVFNVAAIYVYIHHIVLIDQIDFSENVMDAQKRLTELQTSSIAIFRLLWLQMPFYSTFFWSTAWMESDYKFWAIAFPITVLLAIISIWLFTNISLKNVDKKWFKTLMSSEWKALSNANKYLMEIEEYKTYG